MANSNIKKIATIGILCAIAYTVMLFFRIPIATIPPATPLNYEPKDVIIIMGGFLYGPLYAFMMSVVVSVIEMVTVSPTGIIGCVMNIVSTTAFVCTASFIYSTKKTLGRAIIGLTVGVIFMTMVMALWNYLLVPVYTPFATRQAVAGLLLPLFVPFNLFKGGLNAVLAMLIFKPVVTALNKSGLIEPAIVGNRSTIVKWIFIIAALIVTTVLLIYVYNPPTPPQ